VISCANTADKSSGTPSSWNWQDAAGVISRIRTAGAEEEVGSNFLVSCEGAHSLIREQAGIGFTGKTYPLAFLLADVELDGPLKHGENYVWMHKDGSFGALSLPTPRTWRLIVDVTKNPPGSDVRLNLIRQLVIERSGQRSLKVEHPTWISEFKTHCRMADRFRNSRVFVAGDAAHVHSPTGGQGIVTGIQDTANLAWKLARVLDGARLSSC
jgi:2-polyprenyl-6-methoxyphenol hydroxylase-like FAD-dependent oxidoreductase